VARAFIVTCEDRTPRPGPAGPPGPDLHNRASSGGHSKPAVSPLRPRHAHPSVTYAPAHPDTGCGIDTGRMMGMAALHDIVFDSHHPASLARFWAGVLDGYEVAPYDEAELERLASLGVDDVEDDPAVLVESPGQRPRFWFQKCPRTRRPKIAFTSTYGPTMAKPRSPAPAGAGRRAPSRAAQRARSRPQRSGGHGFCLLRGAIVGSEWPLLRAMHEGQC